MSQGSRKAVVTAMVANGAVTIIKFITALAGGSPSMMNEAVHSLMDTLNQGFLYRGLSEAERPADQTYAFGHMQKKYLWNLWSAIGLFSIGAGLGLAHAWHAWHDLGNGQEPALVEIFGIFFDPLGLGLVVLGIAFVIEGYSFLIASKEFLAAMRRDNAGNPFRYLLRSNDPTLVAVVLEDSVAMLGLSLAMAGIGLTAVTGDAAWDVIFSALIALMLGGVAFYLGSLNMRFLADMRDREAEAAFVKVTAEHPEVERYHDLRSIILDENNTVLVAEIELREEAIVPGLRGQIEREAQALLDEVPRRRRDSAEVRDYLETRAAVQSTLKRTERIIDELEARLREVAPRVTHITIEVEGIAGGAVPPPAKSE
ncbi:MAG TPA: cation diffusion facilitator family transporter [Sedimenticola sp.]|nr:cation diffusion facilitator family transporter [Sedimenticola sp.]